MERHTLQVIEGRHPRFRLLFSLFVSALNANSKTLKKCSLPKATSVACLLAILLDIAEAGEWGTPFRFFCPKD